MGSFLLIRQYPADSRFIKGSVILYLFCCRPLSVRQDHLRIFDIYCTCAQSLREAYCMSLALLAHALLPRFALLSVCARIILKVGELTAKAESRLATSTLKQRGT